MVRKSFNHILNWVSWLICLSVMVISQGYTRVSVQEGGKNYGIVWSDTVYDFGTIIEGP